MGRERFEQYLHSFEEDTPVSIRLNPKKTSAERCLKDDMMPVPWCRNAFYLKSRPNFTFDPLFHAGCYYVQEAASMFLDQALRQHLPNTVNMALDLCAAPGGKSTLLRAVLPEECVLYSNEPMRNRASILLENVQKWGYANHHVTNLFPKDYRKSKMKFDVILCDVPCSGEGMFRKDEATIKEWSTQNVEKCRDFGLTWLACAYSVWRWLFIKNDAIGWGSRKETLVDKPGDPDSIFEKIRLMLKRMPKIWMPDGFSWGRHSTFMKLLNPENGAIIAGEAGDNIGRGGRRSCFFVDEAAHLERAEKIEAALGDTTHVRIDISSVNGVGNVFHRKRENGVVWRRGEKIEPGYVRVFIADWRDHPLKTQEWYDKRKARYEREGMAHIFAQEVDRNYAAAVSNVVIPYDWIEAAVNAHIDIKYLADEVPNHLNEWYAGLDVADEGMDRNALTLREWVIWRSVEEWGERDAGITARKAVLACREHKGHIACMYDCIGVGSGVKTEYNRLTTDEGIIDSNEIPFIPWNAGASVADPWERIIPDDNESLQNKDFFDNLKAQAWWSLRTRFYKTFKARTEGAVYPVDELISIDGSIPLLEQLKKELAQPTVGHSSRLKLLRRSSLY